MGENATALIKRSIVIINQSSFLASKLHTMVAVTVLLITLLISPALAGVLDDDVPREKAKMPKLKPPL